MKRGKLSLTRCGIHHHDSAWVAPNIFGQNIADTKTFSGAMLEKPD
jgi:hypothetical protein